MLPAGDATGIGPLSFAGRDHPFDSEWLVLKGVKGQVNIDVTVKPSR